MVPGAKYCIATEDMFFFHFSRYYERLECGTVSSAMEKRPLPLEATNEVFIEAISTSRATMNENTLQVITAKSLCLIMQTSDIVNNFFRCVVNCITHK